MTINGGYVMRAWYDILGLDVASCSEDEHGLRASQALVEAADRAREGRAASPRHASSSPASARAAR